MDLDNKDVSKSIGAVVQDIDTYYKVIVDFIQEEQDSLVQEGRLQSEQYSSNNGVMPTELKMHTWS